MHSDHSLPNADDSNNGRQHRLDKACDDIKSVAMRMKSHALSRKQTVDEIDAAIKAASLVPVADVTSDLRYGCEQLAMGDHSNDTFVKCARRKLELLADADVSPLGQIFAKTTELAGAACRVFIRGEDKTTFQNRFCGSGRLIRTHLVKQLEEHVCDDGKASLPIVGGPSGGGKTMAVLSLSSQEQQTVVAYLVLPSLSILSNYELSDFGQIMYSKTCPDGGHTKQSQYNTDETRRRRNKYVLDAVVDALVNDNAIPSAVFLLMAKLDQKGSPSDRLRLVVFVDEMGGAECADAVRALCCINASTARMEDTSSEFCLKTKLEAKLDYLLPSVDIRLVVGGTGIGVGDDAPGSLPDTYTMFYAYDGSAADAEKHMEGNRRIFGSFFSTCDKTASMEKLRPCASPFFFRMISENARMAAILGGQVRKSIGALSDDRAIEVLSSIDLTQFLAPAIFEFKRKNGLDSLRLDRVEEVLHKVVRMHWFPHALTIDMGRMRTKYGLIVDRARSCAEASYSPNIFPYFTTALLSLMSGNPLVSQSLVSGAPLESYGSVLMYLLACAANNEDLFIAALMAHKGALAPYRKTFERSCGEGPLLMHEERFFQPLIHDMAWDSAAGDATGEEKVLSYVCGRLSAIKMLPGCLYVAVFKAYDKAPCSDAFMMLGTHLFLFQMKDYQSGYKLEGFEEERWKMGAFADSEVAELLHRIEGSLGAAPPSAVAKLREVTHSIAALGCAATAEGEHAKKAYFTRCRSVAGLLKEVPFIQSATRARKSKQKMDTGMAPSESEVHAAFRRLKSAALGAASVGSSPGLLGPRRLLAGLVQAWYGATGVQITTVHRVFITPRPLCPDVAAKVAARNLVEKADTFKATHQREGTAAKVSWSVEVDGEDRFVSVESVRFMPFEADRRARRQPPLYDPCTGRVFQIVKATNNTPPTKNAEGDAAGFEHPSPTPKAPEATDTREDSNRERKRARTESDSRSSGRGAPHGQPRSA